MKPKCWNRIPWIAPWAVGLALTSGCNLFDDLLPTSSTTEEGKPSNGAQTTTSSPVGFSPASPTPYPTPTTGVTAPEIQSPKTGTDVATSQPTLVVTNSATKDEGDVAYLFEVAENESFTKVVAASEEVAQGKTGRTAWQVSEALEKSRYFWRCRARCGMVKSPYSPVASFTVVATSIPPGPPGGGGKAEIEDPLTTGTSVGEVEGGVFTAEGWKVTSQSDYIRYELSSSGSGFAEWDNKGLRPNNSASDQYMLFGMWDPTQGDYRTNPFRVHLQKLDRNHNAPYIRLRWIADGEQHDVGYNFLEWDPQKTYHWRIDWGPSGSANRVRVLLDGKVIIEKQYQNAYEPKVHWVEMGIAERSETVVGVVYANVRIGNQ